MNFRKIRSYYLGVTRVKYSALRDYILDAINVKKTIIKILKKCDLYPFHTKPVDL